MTPAMAQSRARGLPRRPNAPHGKSVRERQSAAASGAKTASDRGQLVLGRRGKSAEQTHRLGRVLNQLHARLAGLSRQRLSFASMPDPRGLGSEIRGHQMLQGWRLCAGHLQKLAADSAPFGQPGLPPEALQELHGFDWLGDLAAVGDPAAEQMAQLWVKDWLRLYRRGTGTGWTVALAAQRLTALIDNALFLMPSETSPLAPALRRTMAHHSLYLERRWQTAPSGMARLQALLALVQTGQVFSGKEALLAQAPRALGHEAELLIDETGGIASRNPEELLEIFALLARALQILGEAGQRPSEAHLAALQRAAPVLRALRHADGGLARFQGGDRAPPGKLDQALAMTGQRGAAAHGLAMGYGRLAHGRSSVILDLAAPPLAEVSSRAQASTLAFELTSGRRPLIVSMGPGQLYGRDWDLAARATASSSTLEMMEISSSRRSDETSAARFAFSEVPGDLRVQKTSDETGSEIIASHDGYVALFGLTHQRRLTLSADGRAILGEDTLAAVNGDHQRLFAAALAAEGAGRGLAFTLRFHLHPDVTATLDPGGGSVHLTLRSGETWLFRHDGLAQLSLEPSAFLGKPSLKPRASKQMVLSAAAMDYASRVRWSLAKAADTPAASRDLLRDEPGWRDLA